MEVLVSRIWYSPDGTHTMIFVLNVGLLHVEKVDLVLPVARLDGAHVHHVWVLEIGFVGLLDNVTGSGIVILKLAPVVHILPHEWLGGPDDGGGVLLLLDSHLDRRGLGDLLCKVNLAGRRRRRCRR